MTDSRPTDWDKRIEDALTLAIAEAFAPAPYNEPELWLTLDWVGAQLGIQREHGETNDAYRARLIATGKVTRIEPGAITLAASVKYVSTTLAFSSTEGEP